MEGMLKPGSLSGKTIIITGGGTPDGVATTVLGGHPVRSGRTQRAPRVAHPAPTSFNPSKNPHKSSVMWWMCSGGAFHVLIFSWTGWSM